MTNPAAGRQNREMDKPPRRLKIPLAPEELLKSKYDLPRHGHLLTHSIHLDAHGQCTWLFLSCTVLKFGSRSLQPSKLTERYLTTFGIATQQNLCVQMRILNRYQIACDTGIKRKVHPFAFGLDGVNLPC